MSQYFTLNGVSGPKRPGRLPIQIRLHSSFLKHSTSTQKLLSSALILRSPSCCYQSSAANLIDFGYFQCMVENLKRLLLFLNLKQTSAAPQLKAPFTTLSSRPHHSKSCQVCLLKTGCQSRKSYHRFTQQVLYIRADIYRILGADVDTDIVILHWQ